jgi:hypothetical protein
MDDIEFVEEESAEESFVDIHDFDDAEESMALKDDQSRFI